MPGPMMGAVGIGGYGGGGGVGYGAGGVSPGSYSRAAGGSVQGTAVVPDMMNVYNQLLGLNQNNYQNILSGYANAQSNLQQQLSGASHGYDELYRGITGTLGLTGGGWGVAQPAANAIEEQSARARGDIMQQMIGGGLGNSTVAASMQNQNAMMTGRAYGELGNHLANTAAGYAAQIGLAQQQAYMGGIGMQNQLAQSYLGNLAGYRFANTAGDLTGSYGASASGGGGGSHGGGGSRGGGGSGYAGMQDAFGWADNLIGRNNSMGSTGAYMNTGYGYGGGYSQGGGGGDMYGGGYPIGGFWDAGGVPPQDMGIGAWDYADVPGY